MFAGSRFCARCGADARREAVDEETPLSCPRCSEPLQALRLGITVARECASCGGLFLDPESLQSLCNAREEHSAVVSALAARVPTSGATPDVVRYVPCPRCAKLMNRVNFAKSSGVIMDVCKADGVWLDRGELQRVIGFVEAGGLAVAREREKERLVDEQRRLAAAQASHGSGGASLELNVYSGSGPSLSRLLRSPRHPMERLLLDALGLFRGS
jgi:Zn-finger nucleic acid-binding protein